MAYPALTVAICVVGEPDRGRQARQQMGSVLVARLAAQPHVDAQRQQPILFDRLPEGGGLAETGPRLDDGDPLVEALVKDSLDTSPKDGSLDLRRSCPEWAIAHMQLIGRERFEPRA